MENCPKCNEKLNIDEKSAGRCFSCGTTFSRTTPDNDISFVSHVYDDSTDNTVANVIKALGIAIIILGTIGNVIINLLPLSLYEFVVVEFCCIVSGMLLIGFAEIIKLLEDIKNK